jgi:hypothetical protein
MSSVKWRSRFMPNNFSKQSTEHDTKFSLFNFALCIIQTAQSSCCAFLFFLEKVKVKGSWTTEGTVRFEYDGGVTVQKIAQEKHDEHLFTRMRC